MKKVSPNRIIDAVDENFKDVLSKPRLKTLAVNVNFKMDNYGGVRIPESGGEKSLPLNDVD